MKALCLAILVTLVSATSALAMGRGSNVCEPYQAQYCGGVLELGHDKLVECLQEHWDQLSDDCKAVMTPKTIADEKKGASKAK